MSYGGGYNSGGGYHSGGYDSGGYNSGGGGHGGGGGNNYSGVDYAQAPNPGPYNYEFNDSSAQISSNKYNTEGFKATAAAPKKGTSKWIKIGIPVVLVLVAGGVVAGILISRNNKSDGDEGDGSSPSKNNGTSSGTGNTGGDNAISDGTPKGSGSTGGNGQFFSSVDDYFLPVYPTKDNPQLFAAPSFASGSAASSSGAVWPEDTFKPATPSLTTVRPDRPRLIAPKYKWDALPQMITADPYLKAFDDQIMKNATAYRALPRVRYAMDGGSGILDVSREKKMRIKAFAYAWRRDSNSQWIDAAWRELQHAMGTASDSDWALTGDDLWYPTHFLDVAEMTAAFAIAYDWMYDGWTEDQRGQLRSAIVRYGLNHGGIIPAVRSNWWSNASDVRGNWNCVCNSGLTMGALAILGDDDSGVPERILSQHPANAAEGCVNAPTADGTWRESPNYWYFGTTGHAEITSSLMTATGGDFGLLNNNPHYKDTAMFHMYVTGMTSLFDYADHGPNKFSTNANSLIFYGSVYNEPRYTLYQRDHFDAPNPFSVFWYDPSVRGAWWNGLALDHEFTDPSTQWVSMRSSWTDNTGTYLAMKSSGMRRYQAHGDLDAGDFVFDAMGERWFGELGSGDYLSPQYFNSEDQDAVRWTYYRKMTEGQNTLLISQENQNVDAVPTMKFESTGDKQGSSPTMSLQQGSTAYAVTDMSAAYPDATSVKRGVRFLNNRKQVLIQDEITANGQEVRWRAHTNATVTPNGNSATLTLNGKTLTATILSPATGATFTADPAVRLPSSQGTDQTNPGVTVLQITMTPSAATTIQVLLAPKWDSTTTFDNPPSVALDQWSLTSHP